MHPRWFTLLLTLLLHAGSSAAERMNILFLLADDWRNDTLGCAGHPIVKTPHLDAIAANGFRFTNARVTTSICGVSRASLLTGQWMSRHGNPDFKMFKTPWAETFPGLMRQHGYWLGHVGKWHCGKFPQEQFDFGRQYSWKHWIPQPGGEPVHVTQKNETDALEFLRSRPKDRPFCLTVNFFAPHAEDPHPQQYLPQPQSAALYADAKIPIPLTANEESLRRLPPFLQAPENEGRVRWRKRFDTPGKYQEFMKNYYRLCTEVDATCGRLVAELEAQELLENTLVIFTTDNGYYHGERQLADKWYPHEESVRVPLIIRDPRMPAERRGKTNDDFVLNVDVAPTILAAAGISAPAPMQGRDFSPLYLGKGNARPEWRQEFFYEHSTITGKQRIPASLAVVQRDWKYILWPEFGHEELFDLQKDPLEQDNVVLVGDRTKPDEKHQAKLEEMRAKLARMRDEAK